MIFIMILSYIAVAAYFYFLGGRVVGRAVAQKTFDAFRNTVVVSVKSSEVSKFIDTYMKELDKTMKKSPQKGTEND